MTGPALKFQDRQHVASLESLKALCQGWPFGVRACGLIGEYLAAPWLLRSRQLQVWVLVVVLRLEHSLSS